jgi:polar amino acid transport system permease protein
MNYNLNFFFVLRDFDMLLAGLVVTLKLTVLANAIGLSAGFLVALLVMSPVRIVRWPATAFVEFFRCTPALIQIVWFFYCVPMLFNIFLDAVTMGVLALGLNLTAFNAEAYRAAIQAIPRAHLDASVALGWRARIQHVFPRRCAALRSSYQRDWRASRAHWFRSSPSTTISQPRRCRSNHRPIGHLQPSPGSIS